MSIFKYTKRDGTRSWRVLTHYHGIRYTESVGSKKHAQELQDKRRMEIRMGTYLPPKERRLVDLRKRQVESDMVFEVLAERFYEEKKDHYHSLDTVRPALDRLETFFQGLKVTNISRADVERYKKERLDGTGAFGERKPTPSGAVHDHLGLRFMHQRQGCLGLHR